MDKYSEGVQQIWDQSSLMTAICPKKYKLSKIDKWGYREDSEPASFGTFAHSCFEEYDAGTLHGGVTEGLERAVTFALENGEFLNEFKTTQFQLPALIRALVWYSEQFKNDPLRTAIDEDGQPMVEIRFEVPVPGRPDRRFSGRIDKIFVENDELFIVDRKFTTKTLNGYYFDQWVPSIQLSSYAWALRDVLQLPVARCMIEAHQMGATMYRCERRLFNIPADRSVEWGETLDLMTRNIDYAHETGNWYRDLRMCGLYGGCTFKNACAASARNEIEELKQRFGDNK